MKSATCSVMHHNILTFPGISRTVCPVFLPWYPPLSEYHVWAIVVECLFLLFHHRESLRCRCVFPAYSLTAVLVAEKTIEVDVFVLQTARRSFPEHFQSARLHRQWRTSWLQRIKLLTFSLGLNGEVSAISGGCTRDRLYPSKRVRDATRSCPANRFGIESACRRRVLRRPVIVPE